MKTPKHSLRSSHENHDPSLAFLPTIMKHHFYRTSLLVLISGLISACTTTPIKQLKTEGFTLSYKNKSSAAINKIQTTHPLKVSEAEVRYYLKSLTFEERTLFGKKKAVFLPADIDRIARLITKAIQHVPSQKIIHYALETSQGNTEGDIFASKKHIHWRFDSINGMRFSGRSYTRMGSGSWRMVPQPGQKYHAIHNLLGTLAQENWVIVKRKPDVKMATPAKKSENNRPPITPLDPALEEKLELLKDLREKELIDEEEYDQKKKELLNTHL